jgi:hypothetical protein
MAWSDLPIEEDRELMPLVPLAQAASEADTLSPAV